MQTPEGGKHLFWGHVEVEKVNGVLPVGALRLAHTELWIAWEIRPMDALTVPCEMDISYPHLFSGEVESTAEFWLMSFLHFF